MKSCEIILCKEEAYYKKFIQLSEKLNSIYWICPHCEREIYINYEIAQLHNKLLKFYKENKNYDEKDLLPYMKQEIFIWKKISCDKCKTSNLIHFASYRNIVDIFNDDFIENMKINDYFESSYSLHFVE